MSVSFPAGTVTFLFTDIEGSTELLKQLREQYADLLANQRRILRATFDQFDGQEVDTQGDSFFVSFSRATEAVAAAVEIQRALAEFAWPEGVDVKVRAGLHTGEPWVAEEGYVGLAIHRAARIAHTGHGGQVLLSETTTPLVRGELPEEVTLKDLGCYQLKDIDRPEPLHQLVIENLPADFPPLKAKLVQPPAVTAREKRPRPAFLEEEILNRQAEPPVFVAREPEMVWLADILTRALSGQGQVAFISGGPGRGKTALMAAFARQALADHPDLLVVSGGCNAFSGIGDPYLPFREALRMLTGEVEAAWSAGSISTEHARRLWSAIPTTTGVLVDAGPDLLGVFVQPQSLLARAEAAADTASWLIRLREIANQTGAQSIDLNQKSLFDQYEKTLGAVAAVHPILLLLDDLQWADTASLNLLFHLGRQQAGARLLILGAYRPEEVALERDGQRHPLEKVLAEFKRQFGDLELDLSAPQAEKARAFVEAIIDSEPNQLPGAFRDALLAHTGGHPLFTIELLRHLQERGDVVQAEDGYWVEGPSLDWSVLPARVEGVIEERIGRLAEDLRETLTVASVEGEDFTAQVIAQIQEVGERKLLRRLSGELAKRHRLVQESGEMQIGKTTLSRYRFAHTLFQQFLYNELSTGERRLLHGELGEVLEGLYAGETNTIAPQLARHFSAAGNKKKAAKYLLRIGDLTRCLFAYEEAVQAYEQALPYLKELNDLQQAARTLMNLGLLYHAILNYDKSSEAYEEGFVLWRQAAAQDPATPLQPSPHTLGITAITPKTLDPPLASDTMTFWFIRQLFSGLLEMNSEMELVPDMARRWEMVDGGRKYIFYLREDVHWSDGVPVTAKDFEYAWRRALHPNTDCGDYTLLDNIKNAKAYRDGELSDLNELGVKSIDDHTLTVELEEPCGYFLYLLAIPTISLPVPKHQVVKLGEEWADPQHIVTNGPYQIESWQSDRAILSQYPDYHGPSRGNSHHVEVSFISIDDLAKTQQLPLYEADRVDIIELISSIEVEQATQRFAGDYLTGPKNGIGCLGFNLRKRPFDDPRVRQAFVLAYDREKQKNVTLTGYMTLATGGFVPPGMPGHSEGIGLPFDPEKARHLLAAAGYPGGNGFPLTELFTFPYLVPYVENLQQQWRQNLKVNIGIRTSEWSSFFETLVEVGSGLFNISWSADYPDPDNFLRVAVSRFWSLDWDDHYRDLVERARQITDQKERLRLYREADRILIEQAVVMPVWYMRWHMLVKPWVKRLPLTSLTGIILKDVVIEPH
jgi:ABC-type oligopeptide transport system substrate-binding subunit/class 3 adenylate cyclase